MNELVDVIAIEPMEVIFERLATEGFRPKKVSPQTIRLRCEARNVWVELDSQDESYFQVFCANIWELESVEEVQWALEAVNHVSSSLKCVKGYVTSDRRNVWVEGSGFYQNPQEFLNWMVRIIETVRLGQTRFAEKMRELRTASEVAKLH